MKLSTLDELFLHELKDLYDAENQLVEALPKLAKAATDPELATAFQNHLAETRQHVARLKEVFAECGETPERETCAGMKGLIAEGEKMIKADAEPEVLDAALISAAQRVEHYEIAAYGTLITWAKVAGLSETASLLEDTLNEEKAADEKLTEIAEAGVNAQAEEAGDDEESETRTTGSKTKTTGASRQRSRAPARSSRARK